jgi:hypothetical protein
MSGWFPVPARPSRGPARRWTTYTNAVAPQHWYTRAEMTPLMRAAQTTVSGGGTATVSVGPAGTGNKWYPQLAVISTTSGSGNGGTAYIYGGFVSQSTIISGGGLDGGGSSTGLAIPWMTPGDLIVVQWTGARAGDIAQLTIYGEQETLVAA